jgi:hypothetical protein
MRANEFLIESWSQKYKNSINCSHPKGFSQKAHCAGKKKHNEDITMEEVCPDCGMCQTHGTLNEIKKGSKDSNGFTKCWPGKHAEGTKKGKNGGQVRNCVSNESEELNEYIVRSGDDIMSVMSLNLFKDLLGDTNLSDYDEEFANSPEWQAVVAEWAPKAEYLQREIAKYQSTGRKLRDAEADAIDATAYDGSDTYENADIAAKYLPKVYNKQVAAIVRLLKDGYANPPAGMHEAKWDPWTGGDFGDDHDMNHLSADDASAPSSEKFKAMIQYYGNDMLVKTALMDLYNITHGEGIMGVNNDLKFAATFKNHRNGKTEIKHFRSKKDVYNHANATGSEVISIKPLESDLPTNLITLPVMLGLGDHKKKWMLQFPDERVAQKWEFQHKNVAQIQWPGGHGLVEGNPDFKRAVDDKGRTQQEWMDLVKAKFPGARIVQAKMIDGPVVAYLPDGKKIGWRKVDQELSEEFDLIESIIDGLALHNGVDSEAIWEDLETLTDDELYVFATTVPVMEDWQKVNKRDRTAGMSPKAVKAYRREHPGSKLQTAVTTKPSKLKKGSKASKRRKSYCSRSRGQMKMHNISCAKTPDKAICKARRRWNC